MKFKLIFILILFVLPILSFAQSQRGGNRSSGSLAMVLEPLIGFEKGSIEGNGVENADTPSFQMAARIGPSYMNIDLAYQLEILVGKYKTELNRSYDYNQVRNGLFIGYTTPFNIRPYFMLLMSAKGTAIPNNTKRKTDGSGHKLGVSLLTFVANINIEYIKITWDEFEENGSVSNLNGVESSGVALNFSFPFAF